MVDKWLKNLSIMKVLRQYYFLVGVGALGLHQNQSLHTRHVTLKQTQKATEHC